MTKMFMEGRVAYDETPITEIISRYSPKFQRIITGREDVNKYGLYEGKRNFQRFIMISQLAPSSPYFRMGDHNIIVTVFGQRQKGTRETLENILKSIKIETRPVPKHLQELSEELFDIGHLLYFGS